ncbi:hypothetical protein KHAB170019_13430 [Acinetobacter baumannii]|uniref:hypothetical protein n=1 Tax=Acinetobacter baumannii TaxID=470 RepID=UPI001D19794C|nr:hypothetical protein [Acinetobacter baumannii]BCR40520.1 hypothetical protein KHAB170019_13430 [Acinetobacter baumannii]
MTLKLLKLSFLVTAAFSSYVQAATSVNDILNKQIIATNSENINSTKVVSELCIFSCDLLSTNPEVSFGGLEYLYVLLRDNYVFDSKQFCQFYKSISGNVILDTQYKIAA